MKATTKITNNVIQPKLTVVKNATKMRKDNTISKKLNINTLEPNFSYFNNKGLLVSSFKSVLL
jgi:hypothetical protein